MSLYTEKIGKQLNDLLEKTKEAEKGFMKAAEHSKHKPLKSYFETKAKQRRSFGHDLKNELQSFGENATKTDSLAAKAHRTWMDIKALFSADNEEAMLEEAIRGEKAAIKEYYEVLKNHKLPPSTAITLENQKNSIESSLATVHRLEDLH